MKDHIPIDITEEDSFVRFIISETSVVREVVIALN